MSSAKAAVRFDRLPLSVVLAGAGAAERERIERERIREDAFQAGFAAGAEAATAELAALRAQVAALQERTLHTIAAQHEELVRGVSAALPTLAVEVTRRVLAGFEPDPDTIRALAAETLAELAPGATDIELRVSPRDHALIGDLEREFGHTYPGIAILADPELKPGDCRARSRFGEVDGRLTTRLDTVANLLA